MKKLLVFIPLACMLACSNGNKSPQSNPASTTVQDKDYGAVVMALPKVAVPKSSPEKLVFDLAITGPGMEPMKFSWYLSGTDTQATVSKIPMGDMRIFTGTLTSSIAGITHTGADTVAIAAGKTTYVSLVLRRTGNAVVDIDIENDKPAAGMSGCYAFQVQIDTMTLNNAILQILSDSSSAQVYGYIKQNGTIVGKMDGPQPSFTKTVGWYMGLAYGEPFILKVNGDKKAFKGIAYKLSDTVHQAGYASGYQTSCDTVVQPPPLPSPAKGMKGCYAIEGKIDTIVLKGTKLQVYSDSSSSAMYGVIIQNGSPIAKISGPQPSSSAPVYWNIGFAYAGVYFLKMFGDQNSFKGIAYWQWDTLNAIGSIGGYGTSCDTVVPPPAPQRTKLMGCFRMDGRIDTFALKGTLFQILSDTSGNYLSGIIIQNGTPVAKVGGQQPSTAGAVNWFVGFAYGGTFVLKVYGGGSSEFKSLAFRQSDTTTSVGTAYGIQVPCDTAVVNPACVIDTMGDKSSCKDMATWQKYASASCSETGMTLTRISPLVPCMSGKDTAFSRVCFECCKK
jgi:hypothetical protein